MPFVYEYPRPAVCVDCVVFGLERCRDQHSLQVKVLLIERARPPFAGTWALPGGFIEIEEPLLDAAFRELYEETGMRPSTLTLVGVYGTPGRDPRGRTISVVYRAIVWTDQHTVEGGDDASHAKWFPREDLPPLAFDHDQIIAEMWQDLQRCVATQPFGKELLPPIFQWRELRSLYEAILGHSVSFCRLKSFLTAKGVLQPVKPPAVGQSSRASPRRSMYFRFNERAYEALTRCGFSPFVKLEDGG
ncbi:MAG: NUDIX domain-containing protein [Thermogutta sp.]